MLLSAVSVLVVAQSSSEIPEGLMNNPVLTLLVIMNISGHTCRRLVLALMLLFMLASSYKQEQKKYISRETTDIYTVLTNRY